MYSNGQGVTQDYKTAVKWYTLAAEQGDASAAFKLGHMYRDGKGVSQNYKTAVKWYTLATEQGLSAGRGEIVKLQLKLTEAESASIEQNNDNMRLALDILNYTISGNKKSRDGVLVLNAENCIFHVKGLEGNYHKLYINNIIPDTVNIYSTRVEFHGDEPVFNDGTGAYLDISPSADLERVRKAWGLLFSDVCDGASQDEF